MAKVHSLKPKPEPDNQNQGGGGGGTPDLPSSRSMQVTLSPVTHVLLLRIGALWIEKGVRPSKAGKSSVIEKAVELLAKQEGLL